MSGSGSTYLAPLGLGASVLERVLMAVINAHTPDATKARQAERLQTAMTALIGPAARDGQDIERALLFMRRQRQRDVCDVEMQALHLCAGAPRCATRTILELATLAAREVLGCATTGEVQVTARLLCRMFRSQGISFELGPDQAREALEAEAVKRVCDELAEWGVPTSC